MAEPKTVKLFESAHGGYGDSRQVKANKYHRISAGTIDARFPGELALGQAGGTLALTLSSPNTDTVFVTEWTDTDGVTPVIYAVAGTAIMGLKISSTVTYAPSLSDTATGGMFDDDGSGVPYIYACYGGASGSTKIQRMNRSRTVTQSSAVVAHRLLSLNGKAYRTITPSGGFVNCQVSVCPPGVDRFTSSNWSSGTTVGWAGTEINALLALGSAVVAVKPEGIYLFTERLDRWVNYMPKWTLNPHTDNGKGAISLGNTILVPTGVGGLVLFDGTEAEYIDPLTLESTPNQHTTGQRISALGVTKNWVIAATRPDTKAAFWFDEVNWAGTTTQMFYGYTDVSSSFTDRTAVWRDSSETNSVSILSNASTNKVWIGSPTPFSGIRITFDTLNTTAATLTFAIGQSGGSYASATGVDLTKVSTLPFARHGSYIFTTDPVAVQGWEKTTVNGVSAYWLRITTGTALTSCSITSIQLMPYFPSIDPTYFPLDGIDRAGAISHALIGQVDSRSPSWHDYQAIAGDEITYIYTGNLGDTASITDRNVYLFGRNSVYRLMHPDTRPAGLSRPYLPATALFEGSCNYPTEGSASKLKEVRILGRNFTEGHVVVFYYSWDAGKRWSRLGTLRNAPGILKGMPMDGGGTEFCWAVGWYGANATSALAAPIITGIEADFEPIAHNIVERIPTKPPRI